MTNQPVLDTRPNLSRTFAPLRWVGCGLLVLAIFDWIELLIPLQLMNPTWELQIIGQLVERVPVMLVGAVLVFLGDRTEIPKLEKFTVKLISWVMLLFGIIYFLFVPLGIFNTIKLDQQTSNQIYAQVEEARQMANKTRTDLDQAKTADDLERILTNLGNAGLQLPPGDAPDLENLKTQIKQGITTSEQKVNQQAQDTLNRERFGLLKKSLKWNLGALVSAVLFIMLWRGSAWTREKKQRRVA